MLAILTILTTVLSPKRNADAKATPSRKCVFGLTCYLGHTNNFDDDDDDDDDDDVVKWSMFACVASTSPESGRTTLNRRRHPTHARRVVVSVEVAPLPACR